MKRQPFNERRPKQSKRRAAFDTLKADGWQLSSRGWPDFFGTKDGGKQAGAFFVSTRNQLRAEQLEVVRFLDVPAYQINPLDESVIPISSNRNLK